MLCLTAPSPELETMKIVAIDEVPLIRGLEHRGGTFHSQTTVEGTPGTAGNFKFSLSRLGTDYSGPRHRHNFDQFRYMLQGEADHGDGTLKAGMLGYFPEGVPYGPQVNKTPIVSAVLQFGGASGSGYIHPREVKAGMETLKQFGEFKDGVFHRRDGAGNRNMDAYQAIWEHLNKREMVYPKGRYDRSIVMDSVNFAWVPVAGAPGVSEKLFGVWTERRTEAGLLKLEPDARYEVGGRGVYFVLSGAGVSEDRALREHTTLFLERGERASLHANEHMEVLHYGLPDLANMQAAIAMAAAAE
jgi:hypothetical protein